MVPLSLLSNSSRILRWVQLPSSGGISPVSWLELRVNCSKFLSLAMVAGIPPTRLLELRSILFNVTESPISGGMVPVRLAPEMVRFWRKVKEERLEGKGRESCRDCILIPAT